MINKIVRWNEPLGSGKYGYTAEASAKDVIAFMKEEYQQQFKDHPKYPYKSDKDALDDFCAIHWATVYD